MANFSRSFLAWYSRLILLHFLSTVSAEDLLCYSCFSLNYRSQVAPRNSPLPQPQNKKNLSEVVTALRRLGRVPPLSDGCPDVSLNSQPSFISAPRIICRGEEPFCAKVTFMHKGEKVVIRDCLDHIFPRGMRISLPNNGFCLEDSIRYRALQNASLCSCQSHLCNNSATSVLQFILILIFRLSSS